MTLHRGIVLSLLAVFSLTACSLSRDNEPSPPVDGGGARIPPRSAPFLLPVEQASEIDYITVHFKDGHEQKYTLDLAGPLPSATPTPIPTSPPSVTPSSTPPATNTPRPSMTSTPEATPTIERTPVPTSTPGATAVPKVCELRAWYTINIRADHTTLAPAIGSWLAGEYETFSEFYYVAGGFLWGHHSRGWSVVFNEADLTSSAWWVSGTDSSPNCYETPGWPSHLMPPESTIARNIRAGPHILMGEGASVVQNYAAEISAAKCLPGSIQICQALKAVNPDIFIIYRTFNHDCPPTWVYYSPEAWWSMIQADLPPGADAYEIENECSPEPALFPAWTQFSIEMAKIVQRERNAILLAFSFGPGHPDYPEYAALLPYLEWVAANPLSDGRYHGIAVHAAPYATFSRPDMPWVNWIHIAGRIYLARDILLANTGFDWATWPGLTAVTEIGLSGGYSGNWTADYSCAEAADAYQTTRATYEEKGYPQIEIWWSFGQIGMWLSDHNCAGLMFVG